MHDIAETAQAEGEGQDGSDKPPHEIKDAMPMKHRRHSFLSRLVSPKPSSEDGRLDDSPRPKWQISDAPQSVPLPPPESGAHPKEPGYTKGDLGELVLRQVASDYARGSETPSSFESQDSDTSHDSEFDLWEESEPPTRPVSRAPSTYSRPDSELDSRSRKASLSSKKSIEVKQLKAKPPASTPEAKTEEDTAARAPPVSEAKKDNPATIPPVVELASKPMSPTDSTPTPTATVPISVSRPPSRPPSLPPSRPPSRPPSVHSDSGQKFTLKDLLINGPKLHRRSSARSNASSKKSDSDGDRRSTAGDSTTSLSKKYGVCERIAIGKGATSVVRLAHKWDRTEEKLYAVKEFRKRRKNETEKEYVKKLTAEFCISSTLHHANIVETVDLVQDENKHWCEVMEYCPGGDLYAAIKKGGMTSSEVECCFKQILTGVAYLHSQGVAHRDIKPENLFFNARGQLKIGDYGASTVYRLPWESTVHMSTGLCGSEPYIAPEQFANKPYDARLVDIWACGIVFYCLHFQELPWRVAQSSDPLYANYVQAVCSSHSSNSSAQVSGPLVINNLSPRACRNVIRNMLQPDPAKRWTIEQVINQSWVQGIEVCYDADNPSHVHSCAKSYAESQVREIRD